MTRDKRWPEGLQEQVSQDPRNTYEARLPEKFQLVDQEVTGPEVAVGRAGQNIQIKQADWLAHGATPGCPKCSRILAQGWGRSSGPHSPACVDRYRRLYAETDAGRARLDRANARRAEGGEGPTQGQQSEWMEYLIRHAPPTPNISADPGPDGVSRTCWTRFGIVNVLLSNGRQFLATSLA